MEDHEFEVLVKAQQDEIDRLHDRLHDVGSCRVHFQEKEDGVLASLIPADLDPRKALFLFSSRADETGEIKHAWLNYHGVKRLFREQYRGATPRRTRGSSAH
jgi:hypothetical protein